MYVVYMIKEQVRTFKSHVRRENPCQIPRNNSKRSYVTIIQIKKMTNLPVLLVAIHCVIYIYSKISGVDSRPPEYEPTGPGVDDAIEETRDFTEYLQRQVVPILKKKFNRLPGVCRRLKRRRITILCNTAKFCSAMAYSQHGHICTCPKGSKCSHFFLWSL
ncbi:cocaine- and amphetamine-regulated transcript protein [Pimephales promelas]|uniref:cocaine- and amphetamine-regulated transcript protein n=1 Tax=Pimephales promelas TaxID=90988 RepID=UPI0019557B06|nr:cocaine- and amphetamine-regulated transcript protein [Pimephales promelas]